MATSMVGRQKLSAREITFSHPFAAPPVLSVAYIGSRVSDGTFRTENLQPDVGVIAHITHVGPTSFRCNAFASSGDLPEGDLYIEWSAQGELA